MTQGIFKNPEERKEKIRQTMIIKGLKPIVTDETRRKQSEAKIGKPSVVKGMHWKIKDTSRMYKFPKGNRFRNNGFKGKHHTKESIDLISKNRKGKMIKEDHPRWKGGYDRKINNLKKKEKLAGRPRPKFCEICNKERIICYDHDHKTGKFRGWICDKCNMAIGLADDNTEILKNMINYLNKDFST